MRQKILVLIFGFFNILKYHINFGEVVKKIHSNTPE